MASTEENIHEHMARVRLKLIQKKLSKAKEKKKERPQTYDSEPTNADDKIERLRLHQALLKRQELLDKIRMEKLNASLNRPHSDRRQRTPPPHPPPSRRSLPDYRPRKQVVEYIVKPITPVRPRLRPIEDPPIPPPIPQQLPIPQPIIQQIPVPDVNRSWNKSDLMEMMMMQTTQMHQVIMQQMMLSNLPGHQAKQQQQSNPAPNLMVPLNLYPPPMPDYPRPSSPPQILTLKNKRKASVHHHHYTLHHSPVAPMPPAPAQYQPVVHHVTQLPPLEIHRPAPSPSTVISPTPERIESPRTPKVREPPAMKPKTPPPIVLPPPPKPKKVHPFPGSKALRKLRHIFYAAWFIAFLKAEARKNKHKKPNDKFLFGILLKEAVAALHRIYLNPDGSIFPILSDAVGEGAVDLAIAISNDYGSASEEERKQAQQELVYIIENLVYHITEIMPATGILGTHRKAAVFEMIKNNKEFPRGYFWQSERDLLNFDQEDRTVDVTAEHALVLMVGIFVSRGLVTTLLMKPLDYGLSTTLLSETGESNLKLLATIMIYLVRLASVPAKKPSMALPYEISRHLYTDQEMKNLYEKIKKSLDYSENLLRDWGEEFVRRLKAAGSTN